MSLSLRRSEVDPPASLTVSATTAIVIGLNIPADITGFKEVSKSLSGSFDYPSSLRVYIASSSIIMTV